MSKKPKYLLWWEYYAKPLPKWEADDLEEMTKLIAEKPPSKSLEHFSTVAFLAGFFQGTGKLGYLEIIEGSGEKIYTPFMSMSGDADVVERFIRLVGDVQERVLSEDGKLLTITLTGLRAVMILRMISQFLVGAKRKIADKIIENGYKISDQNRYKEIVRELGAAEIVEELRERPVTIVKRILDLG